MPIEPRGDPRQRGGIPGKGRRPRAIDGVRICRLEGCDTVLSRYNRADTCHAHAPLTFPRVRGVLPSGREPVPG